jgi:HEXXH motif-containing protein
MHDLPAAFLTLPSPGDSTARTLRRKVRLVALRTLLTTDGAGLGPRAGAGLNQIQRVLHRVARSDSAGLLEVIGQPDIEVPLLVMAAGLRRPEEILPTLVPSLLMGLRSLELGEALLWEHAFSQIAVDGGGTLHIIGGAKGLLVDASGVAVELQGGERVDLTPLAGLDHAHLRIDRPPVALGPEGLRLELSLDDTNPLAMEEAHPDKDGNRVWFGGRPGAEWVASLETALGLIRDALPDWYAELQHTTSRVLPVGFEPEMHLSASYREAPHIMYMTLHPDPLTMAEALIHETQHGKLNLLSWLDPVLHNAYTSWSESPVRPDLRPLMGVLLAVHAFVPVSAFHHALAAMEHPITHTRRFADRRVEVLSGNAGGLRLVESIGQPSAMGERVIGGLREVHDHLAIDHDPKGWKTEAMPPG